MSLSIRHTRLLTTALVVLSLLFSQFALATYRCPADWPGPVTAAVAAMAERMARGEPCNGMDDAQPTLCHQHSTEAAQSIEALKLPVLWAPALLQTPAVSVWPMPAALLLLGSDPVAVATPPPEPVFLSTRRLRV